MRIAFVALVTAVTLFAAFPSVVAAQSFRCENDLANVGDNKAAVAAKCGEPAAKESFCRAPTAVIAPGTTPQPSLNTSCDGRRMDLSPRLRPVHDDFEIRVGQAEVDRIRRLDSLNSAWRLTGWWTI